MQSVTNRAIIKSERRWRYEKGDCWHFNSIPKTVERDFRLRKNIYDAAHANGMKVVDHHDAPVCWNGELGFRTVCERISEMEIDRETGTPNHRFCIMNPDFRKAYFNYACKLVELGADGLQIDEVYFFQRGCLCAFCTYEMKAFLSILVIFFISYL